MNLKSINDTSVPYVIVYNMFPHLREKNEMRSDHDLNRILQEEN